MQCSVWHMKSAGSGAEAGTGVGECGCEVCSVQCVVCSVYCVVCSEL